MENTIRLSIEGPNAGQSNIVVSEEQPPCGLKRVLLDSPERSKRARKSRILTLPDGSFVLKEDYQTIKDGFISVNTNTHAQFDTNPLKPLKHSVFKNEDQSKAKAERKVNSDVATHLSVLLASKDQSDRYRLHFVAANQALFQPFLSSAYIANLSQLKQNKSHFGFSGTSGNKSSTPATAKSSQSNMDRLKQFSVELGEQPSCINATALCMRDYQVAGVNFILKRFSQGMSCILADEMGLGKTIQTIAFLGTLKFDLNVSGPHLIVVPMSVLSNWMSELKRFCPRLNAVRYHVSDQTEKLAKRREILSGCANGDIDIVVTTYEMLVSENGSGIGSIRYRYLVLDEAHKVKNNETIVSHACRRVTRELSLFLTGTPVQNNLKECWSLLNCMQPDVFQNGDAFDYAFDASDMQKTDLGLVDSVWKLLQLLVLRRRKSDIDLRLPSKEEVRLLCPLSSMQTFWYKRLLIMNANVLATGLNDGALVSGEDESNMCAPKQKLSNLIMQLRKVSNHPFLFPHIEELKGGPNSLEDYTAASGKLKMLARLLPALKQDGHRVVIFSQFTSMLNILESFLELLGPDYAYLRLDGSTNRIQRMVNIGRFNAPRSSIFAFLLSTRAGGLGVNLQTADTCILFDNDWNPQQDIQSMGRVHRIGQTKPVTIYRLVSAGTVEERIVARATRKLLLDEMVSIGSQKSLGMKEVLVSDERASDDEGEDASDSDMKKALVFTMKKMFATNGGRTLRVSLDDGEDADVSLSDENLDRIIHGSRAREAVATLSDSSASTLYLTPLSIAQMNASSITEQGPSASNSSTSLNTIHTDAQTDLDLDENDKCFSLKSTDCNTRVFQGVDFSLSNLYKGKSLNDIRKEWEEKQNLQTIQKREHNSRFTTVVAGEGVGKVNVLKVDSDDPSLAIRSVQIERFILKAGRDYKNFDFCQACGEGGNLILCDGCPMAYHVECLGFKSMKAFEKEQRRLFPRSIGTRFKCPHHTCVGCDKSSARAGNLLMRCFGCAASFCEDCADFEGGDSEALIVIPEQPPLPLQSLGFYKCRQAVYIYCSKQCEVSGEQVAEAWPQGLRRSGASVSAQS